MTKSDEDKYVDIDVWVPMDFPVTVYKTTIQLGETDELSPEDESSPQDC